MNEPAPIVRWLQRAVVNIGRAAESRHTMPIKQRAWFAAGASPYFTVRDFEPSPQPILVLLDELRERSEEGDVGALANDLVDLAPTLPWQVPAPGADLPQGTAAVDLHRCLDSELLGASLTLLGPGAGLTESTLDTPDLHLVLAGTRRCRYGLSERYLLTEPGQLLSGNVGEVFGVEPGDDLAVFVSLRVPTSLPTSR